METSIDLTVCCCESHRSTPAAKLTSSLLTDTRQTLGCPVVIAPTRNGHSPH